MRVAQTAAAALTEKYGTSYEVGPTSLILCKFVFPFDCPVFQRESHSCVTGINKCCFADFPL